MSHFRDSARPDSSLHRPPPAYPGPRNNHIEENGGFHNHQLGTGRTPSSERCQSRDRYMSSTLDRYKPPQTNRYQSQTSDEIFQIKKERYQSSPPRFPVLAEGYHPPHENYQTLGSRTSNPPPPYVKYQNNIMNGTKESSSISRDYDNMSSADSLNYQNKGYPGTYNRNFLNRDPNQGNRNFSPNSRNFTTDREYSNGKTFPSISRDFDENNVRDYSSSTNNSEILDLAREISQRDASLSREQTLPRDQSLSGFSRNFGTSPRDFRISRESLDKPNRSHTPPSRHSQTPPSLNSTPPLRHSQASPLRQTQTPPSRTSQTPQFRPIQNHTPPLQTPPFRDPTQRYSMSPKGRYKTAEEYHYDYRGGFRGLDSEGGYTTDGSGSGGLDSGSLRGILDSGSIRGFSNFLYPEHEALLPRNRSSFPPCHAQGSNYAKGEPLRSYFILGAALYCIIGPFLLFLYSIMHLIVLFMVWFINLMYIYIIIFLSKLH